MRNYYPNIALVFPPDEFANIKVISHSAKQTCDEWASLMSDLNTSHQKKFVGFLFLDLMSLHTLNRDSYKHTQGLVRRVRKYHVISYSAKQMCDEWGERHKHRNGILKNLRVRCSRNLGCDNENGRESLDNLTPSHQNTIPEHVLCVTEHQRSIHLRS
ncbi:hypothetical protein CEXT_54191 [Caerostris extrusa]|uniref:Uncharacterized protein n=1 Tax=Caerostris extrusa TaxID=172846 RepID=A0AAV4TI81_CAEEX|nr:hypothetical protein CEXT_54191 [Caerostris extrusa]